MNGTSLIPQRSRLIAAIGAAVLGSGCFLAGPSEVSPDEIPALESRLASEPNHPATTLRYSAALYAAGQCDSATAVAQRGMTLKPGDALAPLVIGQCQEQANDHQAAIGTYERFLRDYPESRGEGGIRARLLIARRSHSATNARAALAREAELSTQPPSENAIAVLPFTITGDSTYAPLSRGLAAMVISDLGILQRFTMVERLELGALLDEMNLAQTGRVDERTAARVGMLVRAGRLVQGAALIPEDGNMRMEGLIVQADGQVTGSDAHTGRFRDLMQLEKQFVLSTIQRLGYAMSEAERQLILENGTQSLAAFLAYSRGLEAEEIGDYQTAAVHFSNAVRADPGFGDARARHEANAVAPDVQAATPGQVTQVASTNATDPTSTPAPLSSALTGTIGDLAATQGEQTTESTQPSGAAGQAAVEVIPSTPASNTPVGPTPTETLSGTIRVTFIIP